MPCGRLQGDPRSEPRGFKQVHEYPEPLRAVVLHRQAVEDCVGNIVRRLMQRGRAVLVFLRPYTYLSVLEVAYRVAVAVLHDGGGFQLI